MEISDIASYRVIRQLGAGGMGQVFLVQHPRLPRQDALKLLDAGVSRNDDFKARFQREADLLAQVSHPNIVTLHDRGEHEDRLWITMEYIEGTDAGELLKQHGPAPMDLVLTLIGGAGAALDYAWRKQKITHRDVKPANILVGLDGDEIEGVKLADFGIAKAAGEATSLTSTGITVGTMSYISPEAIEGDEVDNRSDIYSLGCTAFHLLTGRPPFAGKTMAALMQAHLSHEVPAVSEVAPGLPTELDPVFVKVLAKNPDDRYQACGEFVAALGAAGAGAEADPAFANTVVGATAPTVIRAVPREEVVAPWPGARRRIRRPVLIGGAAALVVAAVATTGVGMCVSRSGEGETPVAAMSSTTMIAQVPTVTVSVTPSTTTTTAPVTTTVRAVSTARLLGGWRQHSTWIHLYADGTAEYGVSSGAMNGAKWAATWTADTATTASITLTRQIQSLGTIDEWLARTRGQVFAFAVLPSGYGRLTAPHPNPDGYVTMCPNRADFVDATMECGA